MTIPSRMQRTKGFKVKHAIQISLLLVIGIWLLYQVKHSQDKNEVAEETSEKFSNDVETQHPIMKLGRKDPASGAKSADVKDNRQEGKEDVEEDTEEETKLEESENEERGAGDDEIDGNEQERDEEDDSEDIEDFIDEEDQVKEDGDAEEENNGKENPIENSGSLEEHLRSEGEESIQAARERHYKGDDASSGMIQNVAVTSDRLKAVSSRKVKGQVESEDNLHHLMEVKMDVHDGFSASNGEGNGSQQEEPNFSSKLNLSNRGGTNQGEDVGKSMAMELPRVSDWAYRQNGGEAHGSSTTSREEDDEDETRDSM